MPRVNPEILVWARETAGLSSEEAAAKLRPPGDRGLSPVERLAAIESGNALPTTALLRKMAARYRRPLLTFYMSAPPRASDRVEDFRTLPAEAPAGTEAILAALVRNIRTRQALVRAVLEDEEEAEQLPFVGSVRARDGVEPIVAAIKRTLGISLDDFRRAPGPDAAFGLLRGRAELLGIYVVLVGDLGSHHTALDTDTFRGFAIADPIAPFVAINDKDAKVAWSFTLLHELAHIWLGQTGISGGTPDQDIERMCNEIATEILLPSVELDTLRISGLREYESAFQAVTEFASNRNVSRQMVAYRLLLSDRITTKMWERLRNGFHQDWLNERRRQRETASEQESGPSFYVVRRHRVGNGLLGLMSRMMAGGAITTSKAGKVLGVRPAMVPALIHDVATAANRPRRRR